MKYFIFSFQNQQIQRKQSYQYFKEVQISNVYLNIFVCLANFHIPHISTYYYPNIAIAAQFQFPHPQFWL